MPDDFGPVTVITAGGTFTGHLTADEDGVDIVALPMDNVMLGPTPCHDCGEPVIWRKGATVAMMPWTYCPHVMDCMCNDPAHGEDGCLQPFHLQVDNDAEVCAACANGSHDALE